MNDREVAFLARFVEESDAIERIKNAPGAIAFQLRVANNPHRVGHAGALVRLHEYVENRTLFAERIIKEVQQLITEEQHLKGERKLPVQQRGHWRECGMSIGGRSAIHWELIPQTMRLLTNDILIWQRTFRTLLAHQNISMIAEMHWRYERIHPFADGNGRSGRALVYYLYRWAGLHPFIFTHEDRHETYYPCFDSPNPEMMQSYFLRRTGR